jgi:CTP synthase
MMTKFIFITGGVVSSLGKGITTASIGALLKICNYNKIRFIKLDPYLNVDPGTMDPFQHGEVYVTEDGCETDLDLGHYERFTGVEMNSDSNITSGKLYMNLLTKERRGDYLGKTVQIVPHLTDDIKAFIEKDSDKYEFVLCEVGGTVGDIEANPMIEAIRQFKTEHAKDDTISIHVTLIPMINVAKELKTKPTQHSVKDLMERGISPDILVCRTSHHLDDSIKNKIAQYSNLTSDRIIEAIDMDTIYKVPLYYAKQNLINIILKLTNLPSFNITELDAIQIKKSKWEILVENIVLTESQEKPIILSIVGKYVPYDDAYKSLIEAINHASWKLQKKVSINWINARTVKEDELSIQIQNSDCVIIPGGFGIEGINTKLLAIQMCRQLNKPLLGICLGMQLIVIESIRNVLQRQNCVSTEWFTNEQRQDSEYMKQFDIGVGLIEEWIKDGQLKKGNSQNLGGTMRLGSYETTIVSHLRDKPSIAYDIYKDLDNTIKDDNLIKIHERHRHRYEVNVHYLQDLANEGIHISGFSIHDNLPEIIENTNCKFLVGCQYHPEFKSTPFNPRPLFVKLLCSC